MCEKTLYLCDLIPGSTSALQQPPPKLPQQRAGAQRRAFFFSFAAREMGRALSALGLALTLGVARAPAPLPPQRVGAAFGVGVHFLTAPPAELALLARAFGAIRTD